MVYFLGVLLTLLISVVELDSVTRVQTQNEANLYLHSTNNLEGGMDLYILHLVLR